MKTFDATGRKRLREATSGSATDQLRSSAAQKLQVDIGNYAELLEHVRRTADSIADQASAADGPSVRKRLARIEKLVAEATGAVAALEERVVSTEDSYRRLRYALLSEANKMSINVPISRSDTHRVALTPSDLGEVRRRRNGQATGAPKKAPKKNNGVGAGSGAPASTTAQKKSRKKSTAQPSVPAVKLEPAVAAVAVKSEKM